MHRQRQRGQSGTEQCQGKPGIHRCQIELLHGHDRCIDRQPLQGLHHERREGEVGSAIGGAAGDTKERQGNEDS
jgi:hypothetical protein